MLVLISCILVALLSTPALAKDENSYRGPAPDWVETKPIPKTDPDRLSQVHKGVYWLMADYQTRWRESAEIDYRRFAYKIVERLGLEEGARISHQFDPTHQSIKFHSIRILRDGTWHDRFDDVDFKQFQRETDLDNGIIDGHLTVHGDLKDLRVDDIVEYSVSITSKPLLSINEYSQGLTLGWTVPVGYYRFQLNLPADKPLQIRKINPDIAYTESRSGDEKTYVWELNDPKPLPIEKNQPNWLVSYGAILSTYESWQQISKAFVPYYNRDLSLPKSFAVKVDEIGAKFSGTEDRITELLRLVQDSIRYVGNEVGPGAYIPRVPSTTVEQGYGDCKDKATLLIAALKRFNIDAKPALAHLSKGKGLQSWLPTIGAFDHVIVRINHEGRKLWVDPTLSHQGGRGWSIAPPDYGYALPISDDVSELEPIAKITRETSNMAITETITLPPEDGKDIDLKAVTIFKGDEADYFRLKLARQGKTDMERQYREYYDKYYPGIELNSPTVFIDDRDRNELVVNEHYRIGWTAFNANNLATQFPLNASAVDEILKTPSSSGRTTPVFLSHPVNRQHHINILGLRSAYNPPDDVSISNDLLSFERESKVDGSSMHLNWTFTTKANEVPVEQVAAYSADATKISRANYMTYDFTYTQAAVAQDADDGDALSMEDRVLLLVLALLVLAVPLLFFGARFGLKADEAYANNATFFPVSMGKFCVMSFVTFGLYSVFWMWKHWRWSKQKNTPDVSPFWRAFFSVIWLYPTYGSAAAKSENHSGPGLGIIGALFYAGAMIYSGYYDEGWLSLTLSQFAFLGFMPTVAVVNQINEDSLALDSNSKYNTWNIVGIILGSLGIAASVWLTAIE